MNKNLTIIDADSLCYIAGNCTTLEEAINKVDERIDNIISNTKADYISLFISKGKYFRHDIFPEYKGNRTQKPPMWMRSIKSYLEEKYEANFMPKVEADDLVKYWMNQDIALNTEDCIYDKNNEFQTIAWHLNATMSAIDKDLLNSIPGKHWNFTFEPTPEAKLKKKTNSDYKIKEEEILKGWIVETSAKFGEIEKFFMEQMLLGDNSDNVLGCGQRIEKIYKSGKKEGQKYMTRIGVVPKVAAIMIDKIQDNVDFCLPDTFATYINYFGNTVGIYEFQKNYRLLHMLENDEDFMREVGELPKFPNIIKVKNELPETIAEDLF